MLDKSLPHIGVLMVKTNMGSYPRFALPEGFTFSGYRPELEDGWAKLMYSVEQTDSLEEARQIFRSEFLSRPALLPRQCMFVLDAHGTVTAAASIWPGEHFGREMLRIHHVACAPEHQGKSLVKALLTRLLDTAGELGCRDMLYLTSQTWSCKALGLYAKFGFEAYKGEKPVNWRSENFARDTQEAWAMIDAKIGEYERKKREAHPPAY